MWLVSHFLGWCGRRKPWLLIGAALFVAAASCKVDGSLNPERICAMDSACPTGQSCYRGFCICQAGMDCAAQAVGQCAIGAILCANGLAVCVASPPVDEVCNQNDDDCDGTVDEDSALECYEAESGCTMDEDGGFSCVGNCRVGTRTCADGTLGGCVGSVHPDLSEDAEDCTPTGELAIDDDCDGTIDETCTCTQDQDCYSGADGTQGVGPCRAGTQVCTDGVLGSCMGEVLPENETCDNSGVDNDCDGNLDDVPMRGNVCTDEGAMGSCRDGMLDCQDGVLTCVTPMAQDELCNNQDDDCDGDVDEDFTLEMDDQNCGMCGNACSDGGSCCGSTCIDAQTDKNHCGGCGITCTEQQLCCSGSCIAMDEDNCTMCGFSCGGGTVCCMDGCKDLMTDSDNCGTCGNDCAAGQECLSGMCCPEGAILCGGQCCTGICTLVGACVQ